MTSRTIGMKSSMASMTVKGGTVGSSFPANVGGGAGAAGGERTFKPCANCNCTPGLLWRQGRRTNQFLRKMSNNRRTSSQGSSRNRSSESVYSCDSIAQVKVVDTSERLLHLRKLMAKHDLGCYIIPSEDEHQSEYVSEVDKRREYVCGFTGSSGVACVTRDLLNFNEDAPEGKAVLSTDGRYFNQAAQQLDHNWSLLRQGVDKLSWEDWCIEEAYEMSLSLGGNVVKIGIDPKLITYSKVKLFRKRIEEKIKGAKAKVELVATEENLVDNVRASLHDVAERKLGDLLLLEEQFSGESFTDKRERLLQYMKKNHSGAEDLCVSALDEICWFLNLRGSDIEYNPVFYAYLLVHQGTVTLFTDNTISDKIQKYLLDNAISVKPYSAIWESLTEASKILKTMPAPILIPSTASWAIANKLEGVNFTQVVSPITDFKAVKNETEIANARTAQLKEAICLAEYFSWLEDEVVKKEKLVDEYKAAEKLLSIRQNQENFMGNSFETISSTGANAAVIHYAPPKENSSIICPYKIYLCDSGSQFLEGTTDITRTIHFTTPSEEEIQNYTLVLKGNLSLERLVFPTGVNGGQIDVLARQYLWEHGLDYRHGTGHGIGSFLNVHEGPIYIGLSSSNAALVPLAPGNIVSNEPGFYKDGEYGIRIENDMLVSQDPSLQFGDKKFLRFENITLVPYCRNLIDIKKLSMQEREQINEYHNRIWTTLSPYFEPSSLSYKWLKRETAPFPTN